MIFVTDAGYQGARFAVVYHLLSLTHNRRLRVRVFCAADDFPVVNSVIGVWPSANWYEREAFDLYGIVFDGWKLVHNVQRSTGAPEFELYDHNADPLDSKDVAAQHADIVQSLSAKLADWDKMVEARKLPKGGNSSGLSAKELARLKGLGYIQ